MLAPPTKSGHLCCARPTPRGPPRFPRYPPVEGGPKNRGGSALMAGGAEGVTSSSLNEFIINAG